MTRHFAAAVLLICFPTLLVAQGFTISGVIQDGAGVPLEGVTVKVAVGRERVTSSTDYDGRFSVPVPRP